MPPEKHSLHLAEGTILKCYEIEGILGKGGFGITYLARDLKLEKKVAIKELLPDGIATRGSDSQVIPQTPQDSNDFQWAIDSFLAEARTLAGFEHPNIVRVYRLFQENNTAYMVMPFIGGASLKQVVHDQKQLAYEDVKKICDLLLDGLEIVHETNTYHRDIKPDNIIITPRGVPMLIDFGSARQKVSGKTQDVTSVISPGYAPIEQYSTDSKFQGPWSDIYALGACAYFMITGKPPAPASERGDAIRNNTADPVPKLAELAPSGFPYHFLTAIDAALALSETQRPQSIQQWKGMLNNQAATPPLLPPTPQPLPQPEPQFHQPPAQAPFQPDTTSARNPRKKKKLVPVLLSAIALLVIGGGGLLWYGLSSSSSLQSSAETEKLFTRAEAYIDANKPQLAQEAIAQIPSKGLSSEDGERKKTISNNIRELLANGKSTLQVRITPRNTKVTINGKETSTDSSGRIIIKGIGSHTLTLTADGYNRRSVSIQVKQIGENISLSPITLTPNKNLAHIEKLMSQLESALTREDFPRFTSLADQLSDSTVPSSLKPRANKLLSQASSLKRRLKWQVTLVVEPRNAQLSITGKDISPVNSKFRVASSGSHMIKISKKGYVTQYRTVNMSSAGTPVNLGTVRLDRDTSSGNTPVAGITREQAVQFVKNYIDKGNSKFGSSAQFSYLADPIYDRNKSVTLASYKSSHLKNCQRWPTRSYTITGKPTVSLAKSGNNWIVVTQYSFEWKNDIFALRGKREGRYMMNIKGKPTLIYALASHQKENDKQSYYRDNMIAFLQKFNTRRLRAGNSDGGLTAKQESEFYSNTTNFFDKGVQSRKQIEQRIITSRRKSRFRSYDPQKLYDFARDTTDSTGDTFMFKCPVKVVKDNGGSSRVEKVKVRFVYGKPYVISVNY